MKLTGFQRQGAQLRQCSVKASWDGVSRHMRWEQFRKLSVCPHISVSWSSWVQWRTAWALQGKFGISCRFCPHILSAAHLKPKPLCFKVKLCSYHLKVTVYCETQRFILFHIRNMWSLLTAKRIKLCTCINVWPLLYLCLVRKRLAVESVLCGIFQNLKWN